MLKRLSISILFLLVTVVAWAARNAYFTIKVGHFKAPKIEEFQAVRALGYIYAERLQEDVYGVYLGRFDDELNARDVAEQVKRQGYLGASVEARAIEEGALVTVVQIATKSIGEVPNWGQFTQAGSLHAILTDTHVKYVTGPYKTMEEARKQLATAKRVGFGDAFIKNVNTVFLHRVTSFEMSGVKQALIPIAFEEAVATPATTTHARSTATRAADVTQQSFEGVMPDRLVARSTDIANPIVPTIRTNVKRRSVLNLQMALKQSGFYQSSLDGLYGQGTASAYALARREHRQLQKYAILAQYMDHAELQENESQLQKAINHLEDDPFTAKAILAKSETPTARAYLAYLNFINKGASTLVNNLMNRAIKDAFGGQQKLKGVSFDPRATYAYNDLPQLLAHLRYIQATDAVRTATPCWLFQNHAEEMAKIYADPAGGDYAIQYCGGFDSWQEIQTVQTIAADLNARTSLDTKQLQTAAEQRIRLFIAPEPLPHTMTMELEEWNMRLWERIDDWSQSDPVHQQMVAALRVSYFQSQILLEDYFMDRGFKVDAAKGLALSVMQSVVDYHLARFQR